MKSGMLVMNLDTLYYKQPYKLRHLSIMGARYASIASGTLMVIVSLDGPQHRRLKALTVYVHGSTVSLEIVGELSDVFQVVP